MAGRDTTARARLMVWAAIAAALAGCTSSPQVPQIGTAEARLTQDRIRERQVASAMWRPPTMVSTDRDVRQVRQALAPAPPPSQAPSAPAIPLPEFTVSSGKMTLEDAVALAAYSVDFDYQFAGPTKPSAKVALPERRKWTLKAFADELEYQTHHYVSIFPESRLLMVTRERMYLAPPDKLDTHERPSSVPGPPQCRDCPGGDADATPQPVASDTSEAGAAQAGANGDEQGAGNATAAANEAASAAGDDSQPGDGGAAGQQRPAGADNERGAAAAAHGSGPDGEAPSLAGEAPPK